MTVISKFAPLYAAPSERFRGGWRQRFNQQSLRTRERFGAPYTKIRSAEGHLLDWGEGTSTATKLQLHMYRFNADLVDLGVKPPAISTRLAKIGDGRVNGHCQHNLLKLMGSTCGFDEMINSSDGEITDVLLPSALIRMYYTSNRDQFVKSFGADENKLLAFWTGLFSSASGKQLKQETPFLRHKTPEQLKRTIPLTLHQDAAPFTKRRGADCLTWGALCGVGSDSETRWLAASYIKLAGFSRSVGKEAWDLLLADFERCQQGILANGGRIADEWDFHLALGKADLQAFVDQWGVCILFCWQR